MNLKSVFKSSADAFICLLNEISKIFYHESGTSNPIGINRLEMEYISDRDLRSINRVLKTEDKMNRSNLYNKYVLVSKAPAHNETFEIILTKNLGIDSVIHVKPPAIFEDSVNRNLVVVNSRRMSLSYTDKNESTNDVIGKTYEEILYQYILGYEDINLNMIDDYALVLAYAFSLVFIDHESAFTYKDSENRTLLLKLAENVSKDLLSQCIDTTSSTYIKFTNRENIESIIYDTLEEIDSIKNFNI